MKSSKRFFWLIPVIVLLLAITVPLLPVYNIKVIEVRSDFEDLAREIVEVSGTKIGSNIFLELLSKGNIFTMRFTDAEAKLSEKYEFFGNISVKADLPSGIVVEYNTKEPVFEIVYGDRYLVTDINGCVLGSRDNHELGFTRITGLEIDKFALGCTIYENGADFQMASDIYTEMEWYDKSNLTAFREYIEWIDLSNPGAVALMYDGRVLVKLDAGRDISYQTASMCVILSGQIGRSEEGILDFTAGENPVFSVN